METLVKVINMLELPPEVISIHISTYRGTRENEILLKDFEAVAKMPGSTFHVTDGHVHVRAPHMTAPSAVFCACRKLAPAEAPKEWGVA
jgi:hypothetical protein